MARFSPVQFSSIFFAIFMLCLSRVAFAAESPGEIVNRLKASTALVDLGDDGSGTSFLVHPSGTFVTAAHVIRAAGLGGEVDVIIYPSGKDQTKAKARVIRIDAEHDVALIKLNDAALAKRLQLKPVALGDETKLFETQSVTVYGYPFGKRLAVENAAYPSISVNSGRISAIRKTKGEIEAVQYDAAVNPGNSGGPIVDTSGKVVAVVVSTIPRSGVSFGVPARHIEAMLNQPALVMQVPKMTFDEREVEREFEIDLVSLDGDSPDVKMEVRLSSGEGKPRVFNAAKKDGKYRFKTSIVPAKGKPLSIRVAAMVDGVKFWMNCEDREVSVGEKKIRLSEIRRFRVKDGQAVVITNEPREKDQFSFSSSWFSDEDELGSAFESEFENEQDDFMVLKGKLNGFEKVTSKTRVGQIDLGKATIARLRCVDLGEVATEFEIEATKAGKTIATAKGNIALDGLPSSYAQEDVNLVPLIDLEQDVTNGKWSQSGGVLKTMDKGGRLRMPILPRGGYSLDVELKREKAGTSTIHLVLPVKDNGVVLNLKLAGECELALEGIKLGTGRGERLNATLAGLEVDKAYNLNATVYMTEKYAAVQINFKDRPVLRWTGEHKDLTTPEKWAKTLAEGVSMEVVGDVLAIEQLKMTSRDGRMTWRRALPSIVKLSDDNLMAYWAFERIDAGKVWDTSSYSHHGTLANAAAIDAKGKFGAALRVNGKGSYLGVPSCRHINQATWLPKRTVALWFYADDKDRKDSWQTLFEEGGYSSGLNCYILEGYLYVGGWRRDNKKIVWPDTHPKTNKIQSKRWHHLVMVLDADKDVKDNAFRVYLDGELSASEKGVQLPAHNDANGIGKRVGTTRFHDRAAGMNKNHTFSGLIDDVRIYNRALTPLEVKVLATQEK